MSKTPFDTPTLAWTDWWADAACRVEESGAFFPQHRGRSMPLRQVLRAKAICARCPVQKRCLETALRQGESEGVWGGLTPHERQDLLATMAVRS